MPCLEGELPSHSGCAPAQPALYSLRGPWICAKSSSEQGSCCESDAAAVPQPQPAPAPSPASPCTLGAVQDYSGGGSHHSSATSLDLPQRSVSEAECLSSTRDLASGVLLLLLACETLANDLDSGTGDSGVSRESAVEVVAWTPSQRRAESQSNMPQRSAVLLSAASEESPTTDEPASTPGSAQVRREKENAEGGTSAKRSRKEHPCAHCGMTAKRLRVDARGLCEHCGQGKTCRQCGIAHTPQWRAGPKGPKTLCNACGTRYLRTRSLSKLR